MSILAFARLCLAPLLATCALGACRDIFGAGGCDHTFRDPLFILQTVTDARTGAPLARVTVRDVTIAGQSVRAEDLLWGPTRNVKLESGELVCAGDCGFGTAAGRYRLTVAAPGYQPLVVELDADYARFRGGCPSYNEGSSVLRVQLTPIAAPLMF